MRQANKVINDEANYLADQVEMWESYREERWFYSSVASL